jgi:TolA-binding protein
MPKKRLLRKDLKQPDEFISFTARLFQYISEHRRLLLIVIAAIMALVVARWAWHTRQVNYRVRAAAQFAQATESYSAALVDKDSVKLEKAETELQSFLSSYSKSRLFDLALLNLANAQFHLGKYDSAIDAYTKLLGPEHSQPTITPLAHNGLALALKAKGEYVKAADHFAQAAQLSGSFLREQALLNQARVLTAAGETEKANQIYQQLVNQFPDSPMARLARQRLAGDVP